MPDEAAADDDDVEMIAFAHGSRIIGAGARFDPGAPAPVHSNSGMSLKGGEEG